MSAPAAAALAARSWAQLEGAAAVAVRVPDGAADGAQKLGGAFALPSAGQRNEFVPVRRPGSSDWPRLTNERGSRLAREGASWVLRAGTTPDAAVATFHSPTEGGLPLGTHEWASPSGRWNDATASRSLALELSLCATDAPGAAKKPEGQEKAPAKQPATKWEGGKDSEFRADELRKHFEAAAAASKHGAGASSAAGDAPLIRSLEYMFTVMRDDHFTGASPKDHAAAARANFGEIGGYTMLSPILEHGSKLVYFNAVKLVAQSVIGCIPNRTRVRQSGLLPTLMRFLTMEDLAGLDDAAACAAAEKADGVPPVKLLTETVSAIGNCMGNSDACKTALGNLGCVPALIRLLRTGTKDQSALRTGLLRKVVMALANATFRKADAGKRAAHDQNCKRIEAAPDFFRLISEVIRRPGPGQTGAVIRTKAQQLLGTLLDGTPEAELRAKMATLIEHGLPREHAAVGRAKAALAAAPSKSKGSAASDRSAADNGVYDDAEKAAVERLGGLRFAVGKRVTCSIGSSWRNGAVVQQWYREDTNPRFFANEEDFVDLIKPTMWAAYQVRLDSGDLIFASRDSDSCIRAEAAQAQAGWTAGRPARAAPEFVTDHQMADVISSAGGRACPDFVPAPEFVASDACFCRSCRRRVGRRQGKGRQLSADELSGAHSTAAKENALIANACRMAMLPSHRAEGLKLLVGCPYLDDDETCEKLLRHAGPEFVDALVEELAKSSLRDGDTAYLGAMSALYVLSTLCKSSQDVTDMLAGHGLVEAACAIVANADAADFCRTSAVEIAGNLFADFSSCDGCLNPDCRGRPENPALLLRFAECFSTCVKRGDSVVMETLWPIRQACEAAMRLGAQEAVSLLVNAIASALLQSGTTDPVARADGFCALKNASRDWKDATNWSPLRPQELSRVAYQHLWQEPILAFSLTESKSKASEGTGTLDAAHAPSVLRRCLQARGVLAQLLQMEDQKLCRLVQVDGEWVRMEGVAHFIGDAIICCFDNDELFFGLPKELLPALQEESTSAMFQLLQDDDAEGLRALTGELKDQQKRFMLGHPVLGLAVILNSVGCLRVLLESGNCDASEADISGWTPLMRAAYHGKLECLELLLELGRPSKPDVRHALRCAVYMQHIGWVYAPPGHQQRVVDGVAALSKAGYSNKANSHLSWRQLGQMLPTVEGTNLVDVGNFIDEFEDLGQSRVGAKAYVTRTVQAASAKVQGGGALDKTPEIAQTVMEKLFQQLEVRIHKQGESDRKKNSAQKKAEEKARRRDEAAARRLDARRQQDAKSSAVSVDEHGHFVVNATAVKKSSAKEQAAAPKPAPAPQVVETCRRCSEPIYAGRDRIELMCVEGCLHCMHKSCARRFYGGLRLEQLCGLRSACLSADCEGKFFSFALRNDNTTAPIEEDKRLHESRKSQLQQDLARTRLKADAGAQEPEPEPEPEPEAAEPNGRWTADGRWVENDDGGRPGRRGGPRRGGRGGRAKGRGRGRHAAPQQLSPKRRWTCGQCGNQNLAQWQQCANCLAKPPSPESKPSTSSSEATKEKMEQLRDFVSIFAEVTDFDLRDALRQASWDVQDAASIILDQKPKMPKTTHLSPPKDPLEGTFFDGDSAEESAGPRDTASPEPVYQVYSRSSGCWAKATVLRQDGDVLTLEYTAGNKQREKRCRIGSSELRIRSPQPGMQTLAEGAEDSSSDAEDAAPVQTRAAAAPLSFEEARKRAMELNTAESRRNASSPNHDAEPELTGPGEMETQPLAEPEPEPDPEPVMDERARFEEAKRRAMSMNASSAAAPPAEAEPAPEPLKPSSAPGTVLDAMMSAARGEGSDTDGRVKHFTLSAPAGSVPQQPRTHMAHVPPPPPAGAASAWADGEGRGALLFDGPQQQQPQPTATFGLLPQPMGGLPAPLGAQQSLGMRQPAGMQQPQPQLQPQPQPQLQPQLQPQMPQHLQHPQFQGGW